MKNILFRGKCIDNGEWVEGYPVPSFKCGGWLITVFQVVGIGVTANTYRIVPSTLGQYTGLTDKNGKHIFEGDIVECVSWNEFFSKNGSQMEHFRRKMTVVFHNGAFRMKEDLPDIFDHHNYWDLIYDGDIEIVGNIYDDEAALAEEGKK